MNLQFKKILGIPICISPLDLILEYVEKWLKTDHRKKIIGIKKKKKFLIILTPNPEIIAYAGEDKEFKRIVTEAQINIPDGAGVVWGLKNSFGLKIERLTGADLFQNLCKIASRKGFKIGLIGGREGSALTVKECLQKKYPKLNIEIFEAPEIELRDQYKVYGIQYTGKTKKEIKFLNTTYLILNTGEKQLPQTEKYFKQLAIDLVKSKIDILFAAFGFPKQEYFIEKLKAQSSKLKTKRPLVMMGVGGAFDFVSGKIPRAPHWIREIGFEWLYRLLREPWRLRRQLRGALFFYHVLKNKS